MFSSIQDQQSTELSQHHVERRAKRLKITQQELKLPEVIALHACQVRSACQHEAVGAACLPGLLAVCCKSCCAAAPADLAVAHVAGCMPARGTGRCTPARHADR